jgi:hypothetical protein
MPSTATALSAPAVLLLLFLLLLLAARGALATVATNVLLSDYVAGGAHGDFNARSLDGSPYEIWVAAATSPTSATKWVLDIQGGAWCQSVSACAARAYTPGNCYLGSSNASCFDADAERCADKSAEMSFECLPACNGARWCGGLFVNDSSTNPLTHNWNMVLLPYHDGQSFSGGAEAPTMTTFAGQAVPLWFRGHANFRAALHYLINVAGMDGATEIALTGNSAGGLATYFHADELAAAVPTARVWAAPDSGFFYADDANYPAWQSGLRAMVEMANSTGGLDASCVAATPADPASCAFPEVVAAHVTTPMFVMQGRYDPALMSISSGVPGSDVPAYTSNGARVISLLESRVLNRAHNAAFVTACAEHCGQWAQGVDGDFNVTISGVSAIPALVAWRSGAPLPAGNVWVQAPGNSYPCPGCCKGGPVAPPNVTLVTLDAAVASTGARCLDGSPGGLYIDRGAEAGKWVVYQQGGGWCSTLEECRERANSTLGSTTHLPRFSTSVMREEDFLSNDVAINPVMWNWTHVYLPYCDGFSQAGDVEAPTELGGSTFFFRGLRVLRAQQEYLRAAGLGSATDLVVAGCSAGGLSVYLHVDKWAAAFPAARVTGLADSGFFLNYDWQQRGAAGGGPGSARFPSNVTYPFRMYWMFEQLSGNTSALDSRCLGSQAEGSQWLCFFAENLAPLLRTPVFALQSFHDLYQITAILNDNSNVTDVNAFGSLLNARAKASLLGSSGAAHGLALDACHHHCGGEGSIWPALPLAGNSTVQNAAWAAWYAAGSGGKAPVTRLWEQVAEYPCAWCCGSRVTEERREE